MADSNESLEIELSDSEKDRVIDKIKKIVNCGVNVNIEML